MRCLLLFIVYVCSLNIQADQSIIGTQATELQLGKWINSAPLTLQDLRGKVVLIRWWTAPDCPFCSASSVALNEWHELYHSQGLQVIGLYHHKKPAPFSLQDVAFYVREFGFQFPVAVDNKWKSLREWWLDDQARDWTSVSFLLDKKGVIQHIHPGGSYIKGDQDYLDMESEIVRLLAEKVGG